MHSCFHVFYNHSDICYLILTNTPTSKKTNWPCYVNAITNGAMGAGRMEWGRAIWHLVMVRPGFSESRHPVNACILLVICMTTFTIIHPYLQRYTSLFERWHPQTKFRGMSCLSIQSLGTLKQKLWLHSIIQPSRYPSWVAFMCGTFFIIVTATNSFSQIEQRKKKINK